MIITTDMIKEEIEKLEILKNNACNVIKTPNHKQITVVKDVELDSFTFVINRAIEMLKEF